MTERPAEKISSPGGCERSKDAIRILMVAPSFDILGGQAVQAARLMSGLAAESSVVVDFLPINPRLKGLLGKLQRIKYVRTIVTSVAYIASLVVQIRRYDVIHIFSASYLSFVIAPTPAILISRLWRKKILLNYHSGEAQDHLTRWRSAIWTLRLADQIVVPSDYLVRVLAEFGLTAQAILNTIDLRAFQCRERATADALFLSNRNFEAHYGVDCVLRAFAIIQRRFADARLTVAGDGPERENLRQVARELQLSRVDFVGRVNHDRVF